MFALQLCNVRHVEERYLKFVLWYPADVGVLNGIPVEMKRKGLVISLKFQCLRGRWDIQCDAFVKSQHFICLFFFFNIRYTGGSV